VSVEEIGRGSQSPFLWARGVAVNIEGKDRKIPEGRMSSVLFHWKREAGGTKKGATNTHQTEKNTPPPPKTTPTKSTHQRKRLKKSQWGKHRGNPYGSGSPSMGTAFGGQSS